MSTEAPPQASRITVIHIDDDPSQLKFTKIFLEKAEPRLKIVSVSSFDELLQQLPEPYNCFLSDFKMPQVDGIHLCRILKQSTDKPFILYTGHGSEEVAEKAFASGVDDYIRKEMEPSHYQVLANRIIQIVEKYKADEAHFVYKKRLEALHTHAVDLASAETMEEIAEHLFTAVRRTLDISFAGIHFLMDGKLVEQFTMGAHLPEPFVQELDGKGVTIRAFRKEKTQVVPDTRQDPDYTDWTKGMRLLSEAAVPFKINGEPSGVINVESKKLDAFPVEDVALLEILTSHLASAVSRLKQVEYYRSSESKWRTILGSSMDAAFVLSGPEIVYANHRAAGLLGYDSPEDLVGLDGLSITAPRDRELVLERIRQRQGGLNPPSRYEITFIRRDGTELTVETNASLIEYDGRPASLSFCRDLTERLQYENKLSALHACAVKLGKAKTADSIYAIVLDTIKSVLGFDFAGIAIREGDFMRYKRSVGHLLVANWSIHVDEKCVTARTYRTGKRQLIPNIRLDPDYIEPPLEEDDVSESMSELAVPINENGNVIGVINVESKELDAFTRHDAELIETLAMHSASSLRRIREREGLEQLVEEKTSKLLEAERFAAHGKIASMVAHDLRGPLQTIRNSAYLLGRDEGGNVDRIENSVDFIVKILEELKDYTMNVPVTTVTCDLGSLIRVTTDEMVIPDDITVTITEEGDTGDVEIDSIKIRRVLNNLLMNSVEAMPKGGEINIKLIQSESGVRLEVSDTGTGVREEIVSKLFTGFVTTKANGHGLGLHFCKRIVMDHGGRMYLDTDYTGGAKFVIELPTRGGAPRDPVSDAEYELEVSGRAETQV
ncbi:GAF domain-containing protein [Candidatus Bathyarchaeota archaeon]|nr:GAF domain-containing protein [Candidatus Bathyarchaeota archaeon]